MTSFDSIQTACVIRYPYLWAREATRGETEGRKRRPVTVGIRLTRSRGDLLVLFPITSKAPDASRLAVEIPETEKRRAGLEAGLRLWIVFLHVKRKTGCVRPHYTTVSGREVENQLE